MGGAYSSAEGRSGKGPTYKGREGKGGSLLLRGTEGREGRKRRREGTEKQREGIPAKVKVSTIKHWVKDIQMLHARYTQSFCRIFFLCQNV